MKGRKTQICLKEPQAAMKRALPVAAVLMLGIGLFSAVHTAKGLGIEQIYRAIDTVRISTSPALLPIIRNLCRRCG